MSSPITTYDPVRRVVRVAPPVASAQTPGDWLDDNQFYTLTVIAATHDPTVGLRAIDGATIDTSKPLSSRQIGFFACAASHSKCQGAGAPVAPVVEPAIRYCDDIQPLFLDHCSASVCHASPGATHQPAAGLVLDIGDGVRFTAVGKPANGTTTGPTSAVEATGAHFAVNMAVIDATHAATSYLLYKLLLAPAHSSDAAATATRPICFSDGGVEPVSPAPATSVAEVAPLSDAERAILGNYVPGREMPFPTHPALADDPSTDNPPLTVDEMERIRAWIEQGANTENCVPCGNAPDGGADAGSDAGVDAGHEGGADGGDASADASGD